MGPSTRSTLTSLETRVSTTPGSVAGLPPKFCNPSSVICNLHRTDGGGEKLDNGLEGPEVYKEYYTIDSDGDGIDETYPVYKNYEAQRIPKTRDPMIINPLPGCFGYGPGPVKVKGPRLTLNTSSFVTYAQVMFPSYCK